MFKKKVKNLSSTCIANWEVFLDQTSSPLQHFANDQQIQIVVKQHTILSNDIETNPGPFFEGCYKVATEFYEDENNDNGHYLRRRMNQLLANQSKVNPIPFPKDFLTDEKVDIWRQCELKIKRNTAFDDKFRKDLQDIWDFWCEAQFQEELSNVRKEIHPLSNSQSVPSN